MEILNKIIDPVAKQKIADAVAEAVQIRNQIEDGKASIKEIAEALKEDYEIKPAEFTKVVETIFRNNLEDQKQKLDALGRAIDELTA